MLVFKQFSRSPLGTIRAQFFGESQFINIVIKLVVYAPICIIMIFQHESSFCLFENRNVCFFCFILASMRMVKSKNKTVFKSNTLDIIKNMLL